MSTITRSYKSGFIHFGDSTNSESIQAVYKGQRKAFKTESAAKSWITQRESEFPRFNSYTCCGDSIRWTADRYDFKATIVEDIDTPITKSECYTSSQTKAWRNNEWFFVGVVISVSLNGVLLDDHAATLWGIECNFPKGGNKYLSEVAQDLQDEALRVAKEAQSSIIEALTK